MKQSTRRVSDNIKHLLTEQNKTQAALADFIGTKRCTVNTWCMGHCEPSVCYVPGIAKFLDVSIERLFEGVS